MFLSFFFLFLSCLFGDVAFSEYFMYHCRFLFEWRVRRTFFPSKWCFSALLPRAEFFRSAYVRIQSTNQNVEDKRSSTCCSNSEINHAVLAQQAATAVLLLLPRPRYSTVVSIYMLYSTVLPRTTSSLCHQSVMTFSFPLTYMRRTR